MLQGVAHLARQLARGEITSRALTEACLDRIGDAAGEGARAFTRVHAEAVRAADRHVLAAGMAIEHAIAPRAP